MSPLESLERFVENKIWYFYNPLMIKVCHHISIIGTFLQK
jgi:hypothetical protein